MKWEDEHEDDFPSWVIAGLVIIAVVFGILTVIGAVKWIVDWVN